MPLDDHLEGRPFLNPQSGREGADWAKAMQLAFTRDMLRREPAHAPVLPYTQEESMQAVNGLFLHALHSDRSLCVQRSGRLFLPFTTQLANTSSFAQVTKDLRDRQAEVWGLL